MKTKYVADDGTEFNDPDLCRSYEILIEASKDSVFHRTVESLFNECRTYEGDHDDTYPVLRLESGRYMDRFKANLVQALPTLQKQIDDAMAVAVANHIQGR